MAELRLDSCGNRRDPLAAFRAATGCMGVQRVELDRILFARDGRRAIVIFRAPDAESVRLLCRQAGIACERIWTCRD